MSKLVFPTLFFAAIFDILLGAIGLTVDTSQLGSLLLDRVPQTVVDLYFKQALYIGFVLLIVWFARNKFQNKNN